MRDSVFIGKRRKRLDSHFGVERFVLVGWLVRWFCWILTSVGYEISLLLVFSFSKVLGRPEIEKIVFK